MPEKEKLEIRIMPEIHWAITYRHGDGQWVKLDSDSVLFAALHKAIMRYGEDCDLSIDIGNEQLGISMQEVSYEELSRLVHR